MVIWLIGLSGSGKTTLGKELTKRLRATRKNIVFLDGDTLRDIWGDTLGHDIKSRYINAKRISSLCKFLESQDCIIVAAVLSIFPEWQKWNRESFCKYYEIFLDIEMTVLIDRDTKGLYSAASKGELKNVVGFDIDFPKPGSPDIVITTEMQKSGVANTVDLFFNKIPLG